MVQSYGYGIKWYVMHIVGCSIDGVDDPGGWGVWTGIFFTLAIFLAKEVMIWEKFF